MTATQVLKGTSHSFNEITFLIMSHGLDQQSQCHILPLIYSERSTDNTWRLAQRSNIEYGPNVVIKLLVSIITIQFSQKRYCYSQHYVMGKKLCKQHVGPLVFLPFVWPVDCTVTQFAHRTAIIMQIRCIIFGNLAHRLP